MYTNFMQHYNMKGTRNKSFFSYIYRESSKICLFTACLWVVPDSYRLKPLLSHSDRKCCHYLRTSDRNYLCGSVRRAMETTFRMPVSLIYMSVFIIKIHNQYIGEYVC